MKKGLLKEYSTTIDISLRVLDLVAMAMSFFVALYYRFGVLVEVPVHYTYALVLSIVLTVIIFNYLKLYQSWRGQSILGEVRKIVFACTVVFVCIIVCSFILKNSAMYSRIWASTWYCTVVVILVLFRLVTRLVLRWLRSRGYNLRRILVIGATDIAASVIKKINNNSWLGMQIIGVCTDETNISNDNKFNNIPTIGQMADLELCVKNHKIDQVWICLPLHAGEQIKQLINTLRNTTVDIRLIPDMFEYNLINHSFSEIANIPVINLSVSPLLGHTYWIKRAEDLLLSLIILFFISPLLLIIAVLVKAGSKGPVFYCQERVSWGGKTFIMYKFRSMPVDVEKDGVQWGNAQKKETTKIGSFLRRTSLDELPQFFNVLKGDMSIVGPRPERTVFVDQLKDKIPNYMKKHIVKAGITGWAQINGWRGDTDINKRIDHDIFYIENWSLWFDIRIILKTVFKGFLNKNAY